jgi:hypothetical protein
VVPIPGTSTITLEPRNDRFRSRLLTAGDEQLHASRNTVESLLAHALESFIGLGAA